MAEVIKRVGQLMAIRSCQYCSVVVLIKKVSPCIPLDTENMMYIYIYHHMVLLFYLLNKIKTSKDASHPKKKSAELIIQHKICV